MKQKIGVLGLGEMGTALAHAQVNAGYETKVWNRTPGKADVLVSKGATAGTSGADVALSSDVILVCIDTCSNAEAALGAALNAGCLEGRVVVQLGTTSPDEAKLFADKVKTAGGTALDGAIMCYPNSVGPANQAPLMVGGDLQGLEVARPVLRQISANVIELGDNIAAAAALDLGYLTMSIALYAGAAQAARLCEIEGASLELLAKLCAHGPKARARLEVIDQESFALNSLHDGASLSVWADVAKNVQDHAANAGINDHLTQCLASFYSRAVDQGFGAEDVAALIKVLR